MSAASPAVVPPLAPRSRLSSADRRRQLIDHAIELFSQRGFSGTRTKDIATSCGVSEGILFRHFATKEDLYRAILESHTGDAGSQAWLREMRQLAAAKQDRALVRSTITHIIGNFRENAAFHRLMLYARLDGHLLADMAHQQVGKPTFELLRRYVGQRQRDGAFREGDTRAMVVALYSPALQFALNKYVFARTESVEACVTDDNEMTEEFTRLALASLRVAREKTGREK